MREKNHPHRRPLRLGFVALSDCAPLVMAAELGLFAKYGLEVELRREVGWATVRDKIIYGELDAAQAPAGLVVAASCGLGSVQTECLTGLVLNLHGNAITLSQSLWQRGVRDGETLRREVARGGEPLTFGVVHACSAHSFLLRNWLRAHRIEPEHDVRIVVVPPAQVHGNLRVGHLDGYCVGEPWNSLAVLTKAGWCVATSEELAPRHPEKVLMVRREFAERAEREHLALIAALIEAGEFCALPENRERLMATLALPHYVGVPIQTLRMSMAGTFDYGHGRIEQQPAFHIFSGDDVNEPTPAKADWVIGNLLASGLVKDPSLVPAERRAEWFRANIFQQANALITTTTSMKTNAPIARQPVPSLDRRRFLYTTAKAAGLAALFGGLPKGWIGSAYASDAPETADLKLGIIALTDCSSIVIAHEKGLFKKYGINSTVSKGASWAAIRDSLGNGDIQATHMLLGMPIASTMGLGGAPKKPMVVPWLLNRNGQAITLKKGLAGKVADDPKPLKALADAAKASGTPMTFAMTFPTGTHAMWLRYWLAAGGVHPGDAAGAGADISLITIPPPQMVANMKVGKMDGYCVGEPWNARAVAEEIGFTAITTQGIWKDHPEKVCAFTAEFAEKNPKTVKAVLKALHEASVWLDKMENREEQARIVSAPTYINCPPETLLGRLQGKYIMGDGRKLKDPNYMIFSDRNCNYPQAKYGKWWLTQLRRWGFTEGAPDYEAVTKQVMRADMYEEAMKEIGYQHGGADDQPETFFDGVKFDPKANLEAYAASFAVKSLKG